jgi:N-acetylneuraminic acid mutarotase
VNGKVYAIGGIIGADTATSAVEEYDPATDKWTAKADMPTARSSLSTSVVNGKIYAIGGYSFGIRVSTVEEYDPVTDKWTKKANMPTARNFLSTSAVDGRIYAIGGESSGRKIHSAVEEYDPMTDKWTKKADMPTGRLSLSTSVVNGRIYAIGGSNQKHANVDYSGLSTVEEYDPVKDEWTKKADMPTARWSLSTSAVDDRIYAIGGADRQVPFKAVEVYDPATDTWMKKDDMPNAKGGMSTSVMDGKIYVIGGINIGRQFLSTAEEYKPEFTSAEKKTSKVEIKGKLATSWGEIKSD